MMCGYPPPPSLVAAIFATPWLLVGAGVIICLLGLWLAGLSLRRSAARKPASPERVSAAAPIGDGGVLLGALALVSSLVWRTALLSWDVTQIDRLERAGCSIPTLQAVDTLAGQQMSAANSLLQFGVVVALAAIIYLVALIVRRLRHRAL